MSVLALPPVSVAIVDDEPMARDILRRLLLADADVRLVAEGDAVSVLPLLEQEMPSLLFLDIEMPEVSGFDLLARLPPSSSPVVVFVTAYDHYALRAFTVHALDYLVKPFTDERFAAALSHAKQRVRERGGLSAEVLAAVAADVRAARTQTFRDRLLVPVGPKLVVVDVAELDWVEAADYYARLHCGGRSYLLRESLADLEQQLDPARFFRIHRSAIVRLDRVAEVHPHFAGDMVVVLRGGQRLTLSRSRRRAFEERLALGR